jgi:hypothetical protein
MALKEKAQVFAVKKGLRRRRISGGGRELTKKSSGLWKY